MEWILPVGIFIFILMINYKRIIILLTSFSLKKRKLIATDENIKKLVQCEIDMWGPKANLNNIDVSRVTNMDRLFYYSSFNGNISQWDVSNVESMKKMFYSSRFNGDISNWNVSNVRDMASMFSSSRFKGDLSKWNVRSLDNIICTFTWCEMPVEPWWIKFIYVFESPSIMMDSLDWNWIDLENKIIWKSRFKRAIRIGKNPKWDGEIPILDEFTYYN